jgi:hypothetical protein
LRHHPFPLENKGLMVSDGKLPKACWFSGDHRVTTIEKKWFSLFAG